MISSNLPYIYFITSKNGFEIQDTYHAQIEIPDICPNCGKSIYPNHLASLSTNIDTNNLLASIFLCNSCGKYIYTLSIPYETDNYIIASIYPPIIENGKIRKPVENLSPNFVKIFNQAITAENSGLDEICGVGYRKALEFLIKDFAIYRYPNDKENIEKLPLGTCINDYCDNSKIKMLAKACAWIGNDETHYVRKHNDYSTNELKAFINAVVTFIDSELSVDAATQLLQSWFT